MRNILFGLFTCVVLLPWSALLDNGLLIDVLWGLIQTKLGVSRDGMSAVVFAVFCLAAVGGYVTRPRT